MTTRDQIIETTCTLIERQGFRATGLNEIVRVSGAPKGSLYYHFPQGKDQIAEQAIARAGQIIAGRIRQHLARFEDPAEAVQEFIYIIARSVEASDFCSGGPLQTVALETASTSARLNLACRLAYDGVQQAFQDKLVAGGFEPASAARLALTIVAAIEGGVLLSRTQHSGEPLRAVADCLRRMIQVESEQKPIS